MSAPNPTPVRVRFAPAPTGPLHAGGARTAIFNWLFARRHGGALILRIENTDEVRSSGAFEKAILDDLKWLGLDWDEGPDAGGRLGPYRQGERQEVYRRNLETLRRTGRVYPCFCSQEALEAARRRQAQKSEPPRYEGVCRVLGEVERERRIALGQPHTWRFAIAGGEYVVDDLIRGHVRFDLMDLGDFIVARSDGSFPYLFASAVDDANMGISHVIRGEDGLSNTPRQALLMAALGSEPPRFAHLPLVHDPEGHKLAKRDPSFTIEAMRDRQFPPEAVFQYLAGLGYAPAAGGALSRAELVATFDLSKISKGPARVDLHALEALSARVIKDLPAAAFTAEARTHLARSGFEVAAGPELDVALAGAFQGQIKDWNELEQEGADLLEGWSRLSGAAKEVMESEGAGRVLRALASANEESAPGWSGEGVMKRLKAAVPDLKGRALFEPVRVSLTGSTQGPELKHLLTLIGRERVRERVARALAMIHQGD